MHRNPTPLLLLAVLKLLSQIFLKRSHDIELVIIVNVPFHLALHGEVLRLLEGRLDVVGEIAQSGSIGTTCLKAFDELIEVGNLRSIVDAAALIVDAREQRGGDVLVFIAQHGRESDVVVAGVVEDVVGRAVVATFGVVAVHTHAPAFIAGFERSTARHTARISVVAHIGRTFDVESGAIVGQWCIVEQHHTTHGSETVADALGTFHHFHHAGACVVHFGGVVGSPTLAFEAHPIVHQ